MAKQLNIDLKVNADTKQAKSAFEDLQKTLTKIQSSALVNSKNLFNVQEIKAASDAARELQQHLARATDVNTGKLNLSTFSNSLKASGKTLDQYKAQLESLGSEGSLAFTQVARSIAAADNPLRRTNGLLKEFSTTLRNTVKWQISSSLLHGFMGAIQSAYGYAQDLNESLNNIRIVTGQSVDQMARFADQANKAAKELSTTTTAYTNASLIYYQQGLSDEEVRKRTDATVKMANVSRQSAEEVSSQMTAIWNNFADGAKNLEYYADVITALGAATAASSEEIATGLEKFAAVADTVGLSYEKATAALATVVAETRQSADVVGTAFKTMFARFQGLKLGETLEDGVTLNKYSEALATAGVQILNQNGTLKEMDTILDELGEKWNTLGEQQKVALAETVGGTRQYAQLMALMNNYDKVLANQNIAAGSGGTLQKQADIYAQSWEAASKRVRASMETIYRALLNDEFFIGLNNGFASLLDGVSGFIKGLGGVKGLLSMIGGFITQKLAKEAPAALGRIKDYVLQITGQARKSGSALQLDIQKWASNEAEGALAEFEGGETSKSAEYMVEVNMIEMLAEKKRQYNQNEAEYSEQEKQRAQDEIASLEATGDALTKKAQSLDRLRDKLNDMTSSFSAMIKIAGGNELKIIDLRSYGQASGQFKELSNQLEKLNQQKKEGKITSEEYGERLKIIGQQAEKARTLLNQTKDDVTKLGTELKNSMENNSGPEDLANKLGTILPQAAQEAENEIEDLITELSQIDGISEAGLRKYVESLKEAGASSEDIAVRLSNMKKSFGDLQIHTSATSEQIMALSGSIMQMNAAMNAIKRISDVFNDEDATVLEKIGAIIGAVTASVFALTSAHKLLKTTIAAGDGTLLSFLKNLVLKTAATKASTIATEGQAGANVVEKVTGDALNLTLGQTLLLSGLIAAAVAALVLIIWGLVAAFKAIHDSSPEVRLQKASEAAEQLKEEANQAKQAADDLRSSFDKYNSVIEKLKECKKGTEEWEQALKDVNDTVLQILAENPDLVKLLNITRGENGNLEISNFEDIVNQYDQKATAASIASIGSSALVQQMSTSFQGNQLYDKYKGSTKYDDILYGIVHNADQYINYTDEEWTVLQKKLEMLSDGDTFEKLRSDLITFGKTLQETSVAMNNAEKLMLQESVGAELDEKFEDFAVTSAIIAAASENNDPYAMRRIYSKVLIDTRKEIFAREDTDNQKSIGSRLLAALGAGYTLDNNFVRGGSNNRKYVVLDSGNKEIEYTQEQVAQKIAAYEAAEKIKENIPEYTEKFNNISSPEARNFIAQLINNKGSATSVFSNLSKDMLQEISRGNLSETLGLSENDLKNWADYFHYEEDAFLQTILADAQEVLENYNEYYQGVDLASFSSKYAEGNKIASKLKRGDTISPEDFAKLNEAAQQYFTKMADGTYQLTEDAEVFYNAFQKGERQQLIETINDRSANGVALSGDETRALFGTASSWTDLAEIKESLSVDISELEGYAETVQRIADSSILAATNLNDLDAAIYQAVQNSAELNQSVISSALISIAEKYSNASVEVQNYKDAVASLDTEQIALAEDALRAATRIGEAAEKYGLSAESLEIQAAQIRATNKEMDLSAEMAAKMAVANQRMNKGITALNKDFSTWKKTLETSEKTSQDYADTAAKVTDAIRDLVNASDEFELPVGFLDSAEHLSLLEQAAQGSQKAINLLGIELADASVSALEYNEIIANSFENIENIVDKNSFTQAQQVVSEGIQNIKNHLDELMNGTITLDQVFKGSANNWVENLNEMARATGMSVAQMNDLLNQLGVQADINIITTKEEMEVPTEDIYYESLEGKELSVPFPSVPTGEEGAPPEEFNQVYPAVRKIVAPGPPYKVTGYRQVAQIGTARNPKAPRVRYTGVGGGARAGGVSSSSTKGSGGSGGGSAKHDTASRKNFRDELERYHWLNEELGDLTREYDNLSKAKDRAFGKNRLKLIEQEIAALDKLGKHNQQYLKSIQNYRTSDLNSLMNGGINKTYTSNDESGMQRNYIVQGLYSYGFGADSFDEHGNLLNYDEIVAAAVAKYNAAVEAYNALSAEEQTAAAKDILQEAELQYESFMELIKIYEDTNNLYQDKLQEILDNFRQAQDARLEALQYELELKISFNDADLKRLEYERKMLKDDMFKAAEYLRTIWNGGSSGTDWTLYQQRASDVLSHASQLLGTSHGDIIIDGDGNIISNPDLSDEGWVDALRNAEDEIYNTIDALWELDDTMCHYYEETLSEGERKLDQYMTKMEDCTKVLKHFQTISELLGKEDDYEWMGEILQGQRDAIKNELESAQLQFAYAQQQYDEMMQRYNETKDMVSEGTRQKMEDELQAQYEVMVKWQDKMYEKTEEYAEASIALYENMVKQQSKILENAMTGGLGFDSMLDSMENISSTQDMILTKTNQIYETNKLMKQIAQDLDKTNSLSAKNRLLSFNSEIANMQKMNTMSKFDLEVAKARYKLLLAQIALEDARNAKSTVRLQRDNEGNFGYVYTADTDKVSSAEQEIANAENDLYNLSLNKANENAQALIQLDKELHDELERIAIEYRGNDEKIQEEQARVREEYAEKRKVIEKDYLTALYWLNETATTDISEAWSTKYQDMILDSEEWSQAVNDYVVAVNDIYEEWKRDMDENITPSIGENLDTLKEKIGDVLDQSEEYEDWFNDFAAQNADRLREISLITNEYYKQRDAILALIQSLMDYCAQIDEAIRAAAEFEAAQQAAAQTPNVPEQTPTPTANNQDYTPTSNDSGDTGPGGGGPPNDNPEPKTTHDWVLKCYRIDDGKLDNGFSWEKRNRSENQIYPLYYEQCNLLGSKWIKVVLYKDGIIDKWTEYDKSAYYSNYGVNPPKIEEHPTRLNTGGYTGSWVGGSTNGKLAFLHQKELVLNQDDTENFLNAIKIVRSMSQAIDLRAAASLYGSGINSPSLFSSSGGFEQNVTIHAEFPNAQNHNEIEEAFNNLMNRAAQFVGRPRV